MEGRFLDGGAATVVLDRRAPHIRLFRRSGELMWAGVVAGDEGVPVEAVGAEGDDVLLLSRGMLSSWFLEGDSLRRTATSHLPSRYLPLGAVRACKKGWRIYLIDEDSATASSAFEPIAPPPELLAAAAQAGVSEILIYPVSPSARTGGSGHGGTIISRESDLTVVLHRPSQTQAGYVLEHTCAGGPIRTHSEHAMAVGDDIAVLIPRNRALEWMGGIVAVPSGFLIALQRWFTPGVHGVDEFHYVTEILRFEDGRYAGSTLLRGQWRLLDRGPEGILLATSDVDTAMVVMPEGLFVPHTILD